MRSEITTPGGRRISPVWAAITAVLAVAGCDPCFGTAACIDPHVAAEGRLIWHLDGAPASGVGVEFWPDGPSGDTLRTVSNGGGGFVLIGPPTSDDRVTGSLVFHPPEPYSQFVFGVPGITIETTRVRGDVRFVGNWGVGPVRTDPHITYVGEVWFEDVEQRATGVEVEFRRTGGVRVEPDTLIVQTGPDGRFPLFLKVVPATEGELVGELYIRPPPPYQPITEREVRMQVLVGLHESRLLGVWQLHP